jgi:signal transduction histidine kinase
MDLRVPAMPRAVRPRPLDACVALALALLGGLSGLSGWALGGHAPWGAVAVLIAMGGALYPRRRLPACVVIAEAAGVVALVVLGTRPDAAFPAVLVSCYSAAVYGSRGTARVLAVAVAVLALLLWVPAALGAGGQSQASFAARISVAAAGALGVGLVIRRQFALRYTAASALAGRASLLAAQQQEHAERVRLAERLRIASDLHDIVAHHLSVVVIQAQAAQRVPDVGRARQAMAEVEQTGRTALEEMRRLLGLLRSGEQDTSAGGEDYAPPLGLAALPGLAERIRGAGLPVALSLPAGPSSQVAPEDVGLTAYRVVQEALTNSLKHAGPSATACVTVSHQAGMLDIEVTDDGRGAAATLADAALPGTGRGIGGMRERVSALGGAFSAGPKAGGGYRVHAQIPV